MADANDDLLDGELEGDFGELDGEEEDALLADDDFMYQTESTSQRSVYIEEEEEEDIEEKSDSAHNKFYHGTEEDVQDVAEGDEILEEEDDVLDLGVIDELESELDEGPVPGGQQVKNWRLQEAPDKKSGSEGGHKLNRQSTGFVKVEKANVSSSTSAIANNVGIESDDDDDEERRGRFKSERTTNSTIICLKSPLKKSLADIPDSLDNVVPIEQIHSYRGNTRGMFRGNNRGGNSRGGFQPPLITIALDNVAPGEQMQGPQGNMRGMWRGHNRGRGGFQRLMRPPMHGMPPRPPMMGPGPYPLNQAIRPLRQPQPQQPPNFSQGPKIHINPHFRGSSHQGPNMRSEWDEAGQHQQNQGPPYPPQPQPIQIQREGSWGHEGMMPEPQMMHHEQYYQPEQPPYQQPPVQYMHHNPEPQVFNNPQTHQAQPQPPQHDRLVCKGGSRITIQTNFQPQPVPNFEIPNRPFNNGQFPGPFTNMQNMPRPQNYEEQFPPRLEYQEPVPPQPQHQFHQEYQPNEWNQGPAQFNSPPPQFYGRELQPPPQQQQQIFRPTGPVLRPPPTQQQQFQSPRGQFRGGIRGRLGTPDKRIMNKRNAVTNHVNNEIPFKQARFEQRKGGPVMSNLHEVKTVDNLPPEVLPDTTTEPEEEDEETKLYRLKIEEQKKLREKVMAEKEARREQAAAEKKLSLIKTEWNKKLDDGPPGVDPEPIQEITNPVIINPAVHTPPISVRGGMSQRGRGSVHTRIDLQTTDQGGMDMMAEGILPLVTVTSSGIRLPTKYKRVKVRTKDGNIITKRTPVLLDGSEIINDVSKKLINTPGENNQKVLRGSMHQGLQRGVQLGNMQQGDPRVQLVNTVRGGTIPVRAQFTGRGFMRGSGRGGVMAQKGRGIVPPVTFKVTTEAPKTPLTLGQRFAMQKNQQQIEAPQPQTKSNRVVMPTGLVQVTAALNTVPLPNSCLLTIDNLSASTTREVILRMANKVGKVKQLKLDSKLKRAVLRFHKPNSAAIFFQRFQRKMVDLSMINITVVPE